MNEIDNSIIQRAVDLTNQYAEKQVAWKQHLLLVSSTLLGILVALHCHTNTNNPISCYCWAVSVVLLALGILSVAISLYGQLEAYDRLRSNYIYEAQSAYKENRPMGMVVSNARKIFVIAEKIGYIAYIVSVLFLSVYACLSA